MTSFLVNCPKCGVAIAKGSPCPDCRWSEDNDQSEELNINTVHEFALRQKVHRRNYTAFMLFSFAAGLVGLLTAVMWAMAIYRGSVVAFVYIAFFTVLTGILSAALFFLNKLLPVDLNCPNCEIRLDELGPIESHCPSCGVQLKSESPMDHEQPAEVAC